MAKKQQKPYETGLRNLGHMTKLDLDFLVKQLKKRSFDLEHQEKNVFDGDPLIADFKRKERTRLQAMIIQLEERLTNAN